MARKGLGKNLPDLFRRAMSARKANLRATRAVGACNYQDPLDRHDYHSQSGKKLDWLKDEGQVKWGIGGQNCDKSDKPKSVSRLHVLPLVFVWVRDRILALRCGNLSNKNDLFHKGLPAFIGCVLTMISISRAADYCWRHVYD